MKKPSPVAEALRAAGYQPCPRWWLTTEQMDLVAYMARQNADEVDRIRAEAQKPRPLTREEQLDLAWGKWRQDREAYTEEVEAEAAGGRGAAQAAADGFT